MSAFQSKSLGPGSRVFGSASPSPPDDDVFVDVVSPQPSSPPTATYPDEERMPTGAPNLKAKFAAALSLSCDTLVDEDLNNNSCTGSATSLGDCSATPSPLKSPSMAASPPTRKASRRGSVDALPPVGGRFSAEDRHLRRQIANCNERRRMQSINAGFHRLREFLPRRNGEKLSKAAILQQTAELIRALQTENRRLVAGGQNSAPTRRGSAEPDDRPEAKRRRIANDEADQHSGSPAAAAAALPYLKLIDELRSALEKEQQMRLVFEQELGELRSNISKMPRRPESATPLLALPMGMLPSGLSVPTPPPPANAALLAANLLKSLYPTAPPTSQMLPPFKVPMESPMGPLGGGPMVGDRLHKDLGSLLDAIRQLENVNFKPAAELLAQMSPKAAANGSGSDLLVR